MTGIFLPATMVLDLCDKAATRQEGFADISYPGAQSKREATIRRLRMIRRLANTHPYRDIFVSVEDHELLLG